jgi:hypothetical protein
VDELGISGLWWRIFVWADLPLLGFVEILRKRLQGRLPTLRFEKLVC